ncbi:MAG: glycosyl hydrolase family 8 [Myxococcales bacterium]
MKSCSAIVALSACALLTACAASPPSSGDGSGGNSGTASGGNGAATGGAAGSGTGAGAAGTGGAPVMPTTKPPSAYTQTAGAKFPYPQNHKFPHCANLPAYDTDQVYRAYQNWKTKMYSGGRVMRVENGNDTVSEGIAYGMLAAVYFNDQTVFGTLWAYAQSHMNNNGLMNWHYTASGAIASDGQNGATDADEDMAWALIMAGAQWGNASMNYTQLAKTLIQNIWNHEIDHGGGEVLKPGDAYGGASLTNPSYFAPSYYRVFGQLTNNADGWQKAIDKSYQILAATTGQYGLVPDWCDASGNRLMGGAYGYDAARTAWRIGLDYCENGEPRAKSYLDKINGFFTPKRLDQIFDGYTQAGALSGTKCNNSACIAGMSFYGPAGVAAMSGDYPAFVRLTYTSLAGATSDSYINTPTIFSYYHASWGVLSMLVMSGNFFTYPVQ